MKRSKFNEEQIIGILKEKEAGARSRIFAGGTGSPSRRTSAGRRSTAGLEVSEARRLKQLEDENRRLKHLVADLTLDNQALKAVVAKKW